MRQSWVSGIFKALLCITIIAGIQLSAWSAPTTNKVFGISSSDIIYHVASLADLRTLADDLELIYNDGQQVVYLEGRVTSGDGGEGIFRWNGGNLSNKVNSDTQSGVYVAPDSDPTGVSGCWIRQYGDYINPSWFGSGSSALQSAIDLLESTGISEVRIFSDFNLEIPIIPKNGMRVIGAGGTLTTSASRLFEVSGQTNLKHIILRNIKAVNAGALGGGTDYATFFYVDVDGSTITESIFEGNDIKGFAFGFSITGGTSTKEFTGANKSIYSTVGKDGRNIISNNYIHDTVAQTRIGSGGGQAIFCRSGYFLIKGNRIENMQGGILSPQFTVVANNIIINMWDDNGIYGAGSKSVSIIGNYIENTKADGIAINRGENATISGNTIVNAGNAGIRLQSSSDVTISGNNIINPKSHFIRFYEKENPIENIIVEGNNFTGEVLGNPIYVHENCKNVSILNNHFKNIDTTNLSSLFFGPYALIKAQQGATVYIQGNRFLNVKDIPSNIYLFSGCKVGDDNEIHFIKYGKMKTERKGQLSVSFGKDGEIHNMRTAGLILTIKKAETVGNYEVYFTRPVYLPVFSFASDAKLPNSPTYIKYKANNWPGKSSDNYVRSAIIEIADVNHTPYFPDYHAQLSIAVQETETEEDYLKMP